jgi:ABC-type multidrug transport system fused ATPase/permease subunit
MQLLEQFYLPTEGRILIDDIEVSEYDNSWIKSQISYISQDPVLFNATILENVRYGCFSAADEQVIEACRQAQCDEFIQKFPAGYQTVVGDRGTALSGGQRQKISTARAILKNSSVLIMDEATSSLDCTIN